MEISEILKQGIGEYVGRGKYNLIYMVGDSHVVKFKRYGGMEWRIFSEKEYEIARALYSMGISVPKPEGVYEIEHPKTKDIVPGFVMEYIPEKRLIIGGNYESGLWAREIKKVRGYGFEILDSGVENTIWCPQRKKIYLIDFEGWELPKGYKI